ncbi:uncharacterized protein LOC144141670 [Haemaphysalis longicornis]
MAPPAGSSQTPPTGSWQPHREPRSFTGKAGEDVDEWLAHYERVSKYNRWDAVARRANVEIYLDETALTWFENHEAALTTWERFVEEIRKGFGDSIAKKRRAEQTLLQRAQVPGETCTTYIEEILKLCRIVDASMPEDDRVGHVLKGIAEDVYNFLIGKDNLNTVTDVIRHCRTFEAMKARRITPKFGRLANVTTVASVDVSSSADLSATIRQIVREELLRHGDVTRCWTPSRDGSCLRDASPTCCHSTTHFGSSRPSVNVADVDDYQRRGVYTMAPHYQPREDFHRDSHRTQHVYYPEEHHRSSFPRRQFSPGQQYPRREPPTCYRCGLVGHISRFCRRRRQGPNDDPTYTFPRPNNLNPGTRWYPPLSSTRNDQPTGPRNGSPASDRSLTPPPLRQRQSPSPRRRPMSPPPGN